MTTVRSSISIYACTPGFVYTLQPPTSTAVAALTWHLGDHLKRSQTPKGSQNSQVERQRLLHNYRHAPDNQSGLGGCETQFQQ